MGVDVRSYKVRIFVLSGAIAGLMGALYAHYAGFITPASASFVHSVQFLMMAVIGGIGSIGGAVLGAAIVTLLPNLLAGAAEYETLVVGGVLFAAVLFMPRGIVPTLRDRWRARRTGARSSEAPNRRSRRRPPVLPRSSASKPCTRTSADRRCSRTSRSR
jgi:branched-chain amino acid transport system permease protein